MTFILQQYKERELAIKSQLLSYTEIANSNVPQYTKLLEIAEKYIQQAVDIRLILEPNAIKYLQNTFPYQYYSEYGKTFLNLLTQIVNKRIRDAQQKYSKRSDVVALQKNLGKYTSSQAFVFSVFYPWARSQGNANFNGLLLDYYRRAFFKDDANKLLEVLRDLQTYLGLTSNASDNSLSRVILNGSSLERSIRYFKFVPPNGEYFTAWNSGGYGFLPSFNLSSGNHNLVQYQTVVDVLSIGPIRGLADSASSIYFDSTPYYSNGKKNLANVQTEFRYGYNIQPSSELMQFPSVTTNVNKQVMKDAPITAQVNFPDCSLLLVVLSVRQLQAATIDIKVSLAVTDANTNAFKPTKVIAQKTITGSWSATKEFSILYVLGRDETFPCVVTVERLNEEITDNATKTNSLDFARVSGIRDFSPSYPGLAYVVSRYDNTSYTSEPKRQFLIYGKKCLIPTNYNPDAHYYEGDWDGEFKEEWTNNPAWIIYDILTNQKLQYAEQIPLERVDKYSFYNCAKYCDEVVATGDPRWTFNGVITKQDKAFKIANQIASTCRGNIIETDSGIKMIIERPQEPIYLFSNSNVIGGIFTNKGSALRTRNKRIGIKFSDPKNDYKDTTVYVNDVNNQSDYKAEKTVTLAGCTSRDQAIRYGRFILATEKFETSIVDFTTSYEAYPVEIGDVVLISDTAKASVNSNGRFKHVITDSRNKKHYLYLDIVDDYFKDKSNVHLSFNGISNNLFIINNVAISKDDKGYFLTISTENEPPAVNGTYTIYSNDFEPQTYRITHKVVQNAKERTIQFTAQKYNSLKFDIADGNLDIGLVADTSNVSPVQKVAQVNSITPSLSLEEDGAYLNITWKDTNASGNSFAVIVQDSNNNPLFNGNTKTNGIKFKLDPEQKTTNTTIIVYPEFNGIIHTSSYTQTSYRLNLDSLRPNKPKITNVIVSDYGFNDAQNQYVTLTATVDFQNTVNQEFVDSYYCVYSFNAENLRTNASERYTINHDECVVFEETLSNKTGLVEFRRQFVLSALKAKLINEPLLKKVVNGKTVYYRPLYVKMIPKHSIFGNAYAKDYKKDDWGITQIDLIAAIDGDYGKIEFNFNDPERFRLVTELPDTAGIGINILEFKAVEISLNGELITTLTPISSVQSSTVEFRMPVNTGKRLFLGGDKSLTWGIKYISPIGDTSGITKKRKYNLSVRTNTFNTAVNGSSVFLELKLNDPTEWQEFGINKLKVFKYIYYRTGFNRTTVNSSNLTTPIIYENELTTGTKSYVIRAYTAWGFFFTFSGQVNISTSAQQGTDTTLPNYPISIDNLNVGNRSGRPYRLSDNSAIRIVCSRNRSYRAIFTGEQVNTYAKKSKSKRRWRDPYDFTNGGHQDAFTFKDLTEEMQQVINQASSMIAIGTDINGNSIRAQLPSGGGKGLFYWKPNKTFGINYRGSNDLETLLLDVTGIEVVRNFGNNIQSKVLTVTLTTNEAGEGNVTEDLSKVVNILGYKIDNTPSNVNAYVIYNDSASKSVKIFTRTAEDNIPISATVTISINYLGA